MLKNNISINLERSKDLIKGYLKSFDKQNHNMEREFLTRLYSRIDAITHIAKGWVDIGLFTYVGGGKEPLTQSEIMNKMLDEQRKKVGFTWITANDLSRDIVIEKDRSLTSENSPPGYLELLSDINVCAQSVLFCSQDYIKLSSNKNPKDKNKMSYEKIFIELTQWDKKLYGYNNKNVLKAEALGGRVFPFGQAVDPLLGRYKEDNEVVDDKGHCYGYMLDWATIVSDHGHLIKWPSYNHRTMLYQASNENSELIWEYEYDEKTNFENAVNGLFLSIDSSTIYYIGLSWKGCDVSHVFGIRLLRNNQGVELYDANLGVVIFKDPDNFKKWFASFLFEYYMSSMENPQRGFINLYPLYTQPLLSKPSVPELRMPTPEEGVNKNAMKKSSFSIGNPGIIKSVTEVVTNVLFDFVKSLRHAAIKIGLTFKRLWNNTTKHQDVNDNKDVKSEMIDGISRVEEPHNSRNESIGNYREIAPQNPNRIKGSKQAPKKNEDKVNVRLSNVGMFKDTQSKCKVPFQPSMDVNHHKKRGVS